MLECAEIVRREHPWLGDGASDRERPRTGVERGDRKVIPSEVRRAGLPCHAQRCQRRRSVDDIAAPLPDIHYFVYRHYR